jgi:hypothetical protein
LDERSVSLPQRVSVAATAAYPGSVYREMYSMYPQLSSTVGIFDEERSRG